MQIDVDALAQEIRRVDGGHDKGAAALAESLLPHLTAALSVQPDRSAVLVEAVKVKGKKPTHSTSRDLEIQCMNGADAFDLGWSAAAKAKNAAIRALQDGPVAAAVDLDEVAKDADAFDRADWYWRTLDPDDGGDSPSEALHSGMVPCFTVCEVASNYRGPTRHGFNAPVLDTESDDEEFLHFSTQEEAIIAAKERIAALARIRGTDHE